MSSIAVVGNGPVGSSVARALAVNHGRIVELFSSSSLWSAHDDNGRITRVLDFEHSPEWYRWNSASLKSWRDLEKMSGKSFYNECGSAVLVPQADCCKLEQQLQGCTYKQIKRSDILDGMLGSTVAPAGLFEPQAGYINPRELIAAQNEVLVSLGGRVCHETVHDFARIDRGFEVRTDQGIHTYDKLVLCVGPFTNQLLANHTGNLCEQLPVRVSRRTVLLCEVSESVAKEELARMPSLKVSVDPPSSDVPGDSISVRDLREAASVYILPPIWYEEYKGYYVKIGGGPNDFIDEEDLGAAIEAWRHADPHPVQLPFLQDVIAQVFPSIGFLSLRTKNCITTSAGDAPLIREVRCGGDLVIIANCQGKAVMASAAIGDEVAALVCSTPSADSAL